MNLCLTCVMNNLSFDEVIFVLITWRRPTICCFLLICYQSLWTLLRVLHLLANRRISSKDCRTFPLFSLFKAVEYSHLKRLLSSYIDKYNTDCKNVVHSVKIQCNIDHEIISIYKPNKNKRNIIRSSKIFWFFSCLHSTKN